MEGPLTHQGNGVDMQTDDRQIAIKTRSDPGRCYPGNVQSNMRACLSNRADALSYCCYSFRGKWIGSEMPPASQNIYKKEEKKKKRKTATKKRFGALARLEDTVSVTQATIFLLL